MVSPLPSTVVVPCFNDEHVLPALWAALRSTCDRAMREWQFVFVDDGSTDDTFTALLRAACDDRAVSVLRHSGHCGIGAALRTAFAHVETPIVCTIDSRCTHPPDRISALATAIDRGADIAMVSVPPPRVCTTRRSFGLSLLYGQLVGRGEHDFYNCLLRAYRREVVTGISFRGDGISAVADLLVKATRAGYCVREIALPATDESDAAAAPPVGVVGRTPAQLLAFGTRGYRAVADAPNSPATESLLPDAARRSGWRR
jgi:dolichol-phosphate mannosyltransferase